MDANAPAGNASQILPARRSWGVPLAAAEKQSIDGCNKVINLVVVFLCSDDDDVGWMDMAGG